MKHNLLYDVDLLGYNYRMNEVEAAIGLAQLDRMDYIIKRRMQNFNYYVSKLKDNENIGILMNKKQHSISSNYCFTIILKKDYQNYEIK